MPLSVATWNINSVRLRIGLVRRLLAGWAPDVLCLQETKCPDANFPLGALRDAGYPHIEIHGQKGYHGVAIVSRLPLRAVDKRRFCGKEDARHIAATVQYRGGPVTVHNLYIPAGGDEPDPAVNEKFAHKLSFLDELHGLRLGARGLPLRSRRRPERGAARNRRMVAQAAAESGPATRRWRRPDWSGCAAPAAGST
jgi:exodeoxyribonuclease-3